MEKEIPFYPNIYPHWLATKIKAPRGEVTSGRHLDTCQGQEKGGQVFPERCKRPEAFLPSFPEDVQQEGVTITPHLAGDGS